MTKKRTALSSSKLRKDTKPPTERKETPSSRWINLPAENRLSVPNSAENVPYFLDDLNTGAAVIAVPFFDCFTEFPQFMNDTAEKSSVRIGIIDQKTELTKGEGFELIKSNPKGLITRSYSTGDFTSLEIAEESAVKFFEEKNTKNETPYDVWCRLLQEYYTNGNGYLELVRYEVAGVKYFKIYLHHTTKCLYRFRSNKGADREIIVSNNFDSFYSTKRTFDLIAQYPNWTKTKGTERSIVHIKDYMAGREYYGLPSGMASLISQGISHASQSYSKNSIDRRFVAKRIWEIVDTVDMTKEEVRKLDYWLNVTNTEGYTGNAMPKETVMRIIRNPEMKSFIHEIKDYMDYSYFKEASADAEKNIILSESWSSVLLSLFSSAKQGSNKEIENEIKRVMKFVIRPQRTNVLEGFNVAFNEYCNWMGLNVKGYSLGISDGQNEFIDVDYNKVMTVNERRRNVGLNPLMDDNGNETAEGHTI